MIMRPVFVPPTPPDICRSCGSENVDLSVHRVCGRCETVCIACGNPTGMLRSDHCPECRSRGRGR